MTLCRDWDFRDLSGWFWSEKFDGCRAFWDGFKLWTRDGNVVKAPAKFIAALPHGIPLDGELWAGRGTLTVSMVATRHGKWSEHVRFVVFDAPGQTGNWLERMAFADRFRNDLVLTCERGTVSDRDEASNIARRFIEAGGEGAVFRNPKVTTYETKRTINCVRIKAGNLVEPWREASGRWKASVRQRQARTEAQFRSAMRDFETSGRFHIGGRVVGVHPALFAFDPMIDNLVNS